MVIKGNGAVNTMEAVKINTKEKERTKVTYHKSVFSSVLTGITCGAAILALAILVFLVGFILIHGVKNLHWSSLHGPIIQRMLRCFRRSSTLLR